MHFHCLIGGCGRGTTHILFRSEQGEDEPTNVLQQKKLQLDIGGELCSSQGIGQHLAQGPREAVKSLFLEIFRV